MRSVEIELKERLNLHEGDELIFAETLHEDYAKQRNPVVGKMPEFSESEMYGYVIVKRQDGKMGIYTHNGEVVVPEDEHKCYPQYWCSYGFYHEAICIEKDGKIEVRSCDGKKVILPSEFQEVKLLERFITTSNDGKTWGAYSYEGKEILPSVYNRCFSENVGSDFIIIVINEQYLFGVYSSRGEVILPCEYKYIHYTECHDVLFVTKKDETVCMYSAEGEPFIDCHADRLRWNSSITDSIFANGKFPNDFILATRNKVPVGLYRYTGTQIVVDPAKYSKMYLEKEYIICIGKEGVSMDAYDFNGDKIVEYKP